MKTRYSFLLLLLFLFCSEYASAQTHYDNLKADEKQRAIDNERNKERDRQNLENNRPVEKEKTSTSDTNSNQSYTDMAKSIIGYKEPELTEAEKAAKEKYIQEYNEKKRLENVRMTPEQIRQADESVAQYYRDRANEEMILKPFIDKLTEAGYSRDDAQQVMSRYKSDLLASTFYSKSRDKEFEQEIIVFLKVKDNSKKISFETLSQDAVNLISARSYTSSLDYLTLLEKQFSEKKADVDLLRKEVFKSYFWHEASYGDMSNTAKKKLIDDYFLFEEANPTFYNELHNFLKGKLGMSPYKIVKSHYEDKLDCNICSYSGKEKKEFKDAIEKYKSREEAVIKNTFKGYYREDSSKGKISYFNSDKVEITIEEFMIHQLELNYKDDLRFEPKMTLDLIQKLAAIKKVEPTVFINDFLRIEPKDKFELLLKMANNNDYQAMRSAFEQERKERDKEINASYHLKEKWYDFFAGKAVEGDVEAMKMLYQAYKNYHQKLFNNKNTSHPKHFEKTFIAFEGKASEKDVFDFAKYLALEFYDRYLYNTKFSYEYLQKIKAVGVKTIFKLAEEGDSKAIDLLNDLKKMENNE